MVSNWHFADDSVGAFALVCSPPSLSFRANQSVPCKLRPQLSLSISTPQPFFSHSILGSDPYMPPHEFGHFTNGLKSKDENKWGGHNVRDNENPVRRGLKLDDRESYKGVPIKRPY